MSYHGTNTNYNSYTRDYPKTFYRNMATVTADPSAPQIILNPNDQPMKATLDAYSQGYLSPQENNPVMLSGANYYSINTGYGRNPKNLYTTRSCSGRVGDPTIAIAPFGEKVNPADWISPGVPRPVQSKSSWIEAFKF